MYAFAPSCPSGPKKASSACHGCYFRTFHAPAREMLSRASGLFDKALLEGVRGDSLMTFAQQMAAWSVFYATVAALSGTFIGLVFVALSLNPRIMVASGPSGLRILAAQTFRRFLMILVIALVALIPDDSALALLLTLLIIGVVGVIRLVNDVRQVRLDPDPHWSTEQSFLRYVSPAIAYLLAIGLAIDLHDGGSNALGGIAAIMGLLLISAAADCWDLLAEIGQQSTDA